MMEQFLFYVLDGILAIALGAFLKFGIPYIKSAINVKNLAFITEWVNKAVAAAEQTIRGTKMGEKRKEQVISFLEKMGIVVDDAVLTIMEAAVKSLQSGIDNAANLITDKIEDLTNGTANVNEEFAKEAINSVTESNIFTSIEESK